MVTKLRYATPDVMQWARHIPNAVFLTTVFHLNPKVKKQLDKLKVRDVLQNDCLNFSKMSTSWNIQEVWGVILVCQRRLNKWQLMSSIMLDWFLYSIKICKLHYWNNYANLNIDWMLDIFISVLNFFGVIVVI